MCAQVAGCLLQLLERLAMRACRESAERVLQHVSDGSASDDSPLQMNRAADYHSSVVRHLARHVRRAYCSLYTGVLRKCLYAVALHAARLCAASMVQRCVARKFRDRALPSSLALIHTTTYRCIPRQTCFYTAHTRIAVLVGTDSAAWNSLCSLIVCATYRILALVHRIARSHDCSCDGGGVLGEAKNGRDNEVTRKLRNS